MKCLPICAMLLIVQVAFGETANGIHKQLETAATATGAVYIAARNDLVTCGSNAVPQLAEISANTNEPWRVRLMAGIVAERIQRGAEITALVHKNWRDDPEYKSDWDKYRGSARGLILLVGKRYKEFGLIWHGVELTWKETEEHSKTVRMDEDWWRSAAGGACINSAAYNFLVKVLEERIRNDIGFTKYERWGEFIFLLNSKTNTPLPFLLEIIPSIPVNDPRQRDDYMFKTVTGMAHPEDVPLIEKHFKDKGQDVPEMLREPLRKLKERQNLNSAAH